MMKKRLYNALVAGLGSMMLTACAVNPRNVNVDLNETLPEVKSTTFSQGIIDLGLMSEIFGADKLHIMSKSIVDNTGTSIATKAEIPQDVTEMVKSTLNGIGGNIVYIPYDPEMMLNLAEVGYYGFGEKLIPHVVVSGGITEFDRSLVTKGKDIDFDVEGSIEGKSAGIDFTDRVKDALASITLDFNLIDFKTFAGIPRVQAINNIRVHKALAEDSLGFTLLGATAGARGEIKKIQGRHAAVRLLVQLSMIQIIGKHQKLPYWRLVPGAEPDLMVMDAVLNEFYAMDESQRLARVQELLYLHGHDVALTGRLDDPTRRALDEFRGKHSAVSGSPDEATYRVLYETVPITRETRGRRALIERLAVAAKPAPPEAPGVDPAKDAPLIRGEFTAEPAPNAHVATSADGQLRLWTDTATYRIGEPMTVNFEVVQPLYVRIVTVNTSGEVVTLYPNVYQPDNYSSPGKQHRIPPAGGKFSLTVQGPAGTDKIVAVASTTPILADAVIFTSTGEMNPDSIKNLPIRIGLDVAIR